MTKRTRWIVAGLALALSPLLPAQESPAKEEEKKGIFGKDLIGKLKDKAPDALTGPLGELKERVGDSIEQMKSLEGQVKALREEVKDLRTRVELLEDDNAQLQDQLASAADNAASAAAAGEGAGDGSSVAVRADGLSKAYGADSKGADKIYLDTYLSVSGRVQKFKAGTSKETYLYLTGSTGGPLIICGFFKDADFAVDTVEHEGRMVNRADNTTFLSVGQWITVNGTCKGKGINVELRNCSIKDMKPKPVPERQDNKK